jgi:hypothetical protein
MVRRGFNLYECVYGEQEIRAWIREKSAVPEWDASGLGQGDKTVAVYDLLFAAGAKYKSTHYEGEREVRLISVSHHRWQYVNSPSMYEKDRPIHFRDHPTYGIPVPYVKFFLPVEQKADDSAEHRPPETATEMKRRKLEEEEKMPRGLLPIKEVLIGPMAHQSEAKLACEIMLAEKGYDGIPVTASEIPYRGS